MKDKYDVVIIGAGPAGCSAAKILREKGLDVIIIEKIKNPPRRPCAGILAERTMTFLENNYPPIDKDMIMSDKIKISVSKRGGRFIVPSLNLVKVDRGRFDTWLYKQSQSSIVIGAYQKHEKEGKYYKIYYLDEQKNTITIKTDYIIGADGAFSRVRRTAVKDITLKNMYLNIQVLYEIESSKIESGNFHFLFHKKFSEYFASFGLETEDVLNFNSCWSITNSLNPAEYYMDNLFNYLVDNFDLKVKGVIKKSACLVNAITTLDKFSSGKERVLLTGEAAGLLTGLGEGISYALMTGKMAAEAIIKNSIKEYRQLIIPYFQEVLKTM